MLLNDFSGGLSLLDNVNANELADALNVVIDKGGRLESRLGYQKHIAGMLPAEGHAVYWSTNRLRFFVQAGNDLYLNTGSGWTNSFELVSLPGFSSEDRAVFADFADLPGTFYELVTPPGDERWRGPWNSGTNYAADQIVSHDGALYKSNQSTLNDEPPAAEWDLFDVAFQGDWVGYTSNYQAGDLVTHEGSLWECEQNDTIEIPGDGSDWTEVEEYRGDWTSDSDPYLVSQLVVAALPSEPGPSSGGQQVFRALVNGPSGALVAGAQWEAAADIFTHTGNPLTFLWAAGNYTVGREVIHDGILYRLVDALLLLSNEPNLSPDLLPSKWLPLSNWEGVWDSGRAADPFYATGDLVTHDDDLWERSLPSFDTGDVVRYEVDGTSGVWVADDDGVDGEPGTDPDWIEVEPFELGDTPYASGSVVLHFGNVYRANTETSEEPPHDDWDLLDPETWPGDPGEPGVGNGWQEVTEYLGDHALIPTLYEAEDYVVHDSDLYVAVVANGDPPSIPGVSDDWELYLPLSDGSGEYTLLHPRPPVMVLHPEDGLYAITMVTFEIGEDTLNRWWVFSDLGPEEDGEQAIRGSAMAVWQDKLWVGSHLSPRLYASAVGDPSAWTTEATPDEEAEENGALFVDVRDLNNEPITALAVSSRLGLVAFKAHSAHRVDDSTTGAFSTIDPTTGAPHQNAVVATDDRIVAVNRTGVYVTDGVSQLVKVSRKLELLFAGVDEDSIRVGATPEGRVLICFDNTVGHVHLEYDTERAHFTRHDLSFHAFTTDGTNTYGLTGTHLHRLNTGGTDDGAPIEWYAQTGWVPLNEFKLARAQRVRVQSRGPGTFKIVKDRSVDGFGGTVSGALGYTEFYPRLLAREIAVRVEGETSTASAFALHGAGIDVQGVEA